MKKILLPCLLALNTVVVAKATDVKTISIDYPTPSRDFTMFYTNGVGTEGCLLGKTTLSTNNSIVIQKLGNNVNPFSIGYLDTSALDAAFTYLGVSYTTIDANEMPTNNANKDAATTITERGLAFYDLNYCAAGVLYPGDYETISKVEFADINNTSTLTDGYEDFTSIIGNVVQGQSYPIEVTINKYDDDFTTVWIDYNQDGDFSDDEKVSLAHSNPSTGSITIPTTAKLGKTRMRVRANWDSEGTACGNGYFGQVEDYSLEIRGPSMSVSDINKSNVSVYPNPFKDILRISDIKDVTSVIISDLSGRKISEQKPSAEFNLSHLNKGVYMVNVKYSNGEVKSTKVIKE